MFVGVVFVGVVFVGLAFVVASVGSVIEILIENLPDKSEASWMHVECWNCFRWRCIRRFG